MEQAHRNSLQRNATLLIKDLEINEEFLSVFAEERVLTDSMIEEIEVNRTSAAKAREFCRIIPKRGRKAFPTLIEALMRTEQTDIAYALSSDLANKWESEHTNAASHQPSGRSISDRHATGHGFTPKVQPGLAMDPPRTIEDTGESLINIDILNVDSRVAQQVLQKTKEIYTMKTNPRGRAVILNNEMFSGTMNDRDGSVFDAVNLDQLFTQLGFDTETWTNVKSQELAEHLKKERHHPAHRKADAFIFTILSHGNQGRIFTSDGKSYELDKIFAHFDGYACPDLIGKPKIFLIQACQGKLESLIHSDDNSDSQVVTEEEKELETKLPQIVNKDTSRTVPVIHEKSDFILAYSTVPGYRSWRNTEQGTWFIRDLIYTFMERCHCEHLLDMLLEVNRKQQQRIARQRQVSEVRNSTTKKVYFLPGYSE